MAAPKKAAGAGKKPTVRTVRCARITIQTTPEFAQLVHDAAQKTGATTSQWAEQHLRRALGLPHI